MMVVPAAALVIHYDQLVVAVSAVVMMVVMMFAALVVHHDVVGVAVFDRAGSGRAARAECDRDGSDDQDVARSILQEGLPCRGRADRLRGPALE